MNLKTAITTATILITCMGAGYVAGHSARPMKIAEIPDEFQPAEKVVPPVPPQPLEPEPETLAEVKPDPEAELELLRKLLGFARDELRSDGIDLLAAARGKVRIGRIPQEMIPAALELVAAMPGGYDVESELADALISRWAEVDGEAACEFSLANRTPMGPSKPPICEALKSWATHDPQAALDWYLDRRDEKHPGLHEQRVNEKEPLSRIYSIFGVWARTDLDGALAAMNMFEDKHLRRSAMYGISIEAGPLQDREKLFDLVATWPKLRTH